MSTYGAPIQTPAHALYNHVTGRSSDLGERLALLNTAANLGADPDTVKIVRQWLWNDYQAIAQ